MKQYKIYTKGNYIVIVDVQKNEYFYGIRKEVHIDKSNVDKAVYRAFNVKDFSSSIILAVPNILKENGDAYSEAEFDTFYQENTGNFNGGGSAPTVLSVTGDSVDNTDPQNPIINAIPLTGTEEGSPVTGNIEFSTDNGVSRLYGKSEGSNSSAQIDFIDSGTLALRGVDDNEDTVFEFGFNGDRGIVSVNDFSENITDLDYTQKIYVDKANSYSLDETLTGGTWIDGKPIYRKVYVSTTNASGTTIISIPEGYIKQVVNATIIIEEGLNLQYVINPKIEYDVDALKFTNSEDSSPFNLILEYTKTTD